MRSRKLLVALSVGCLVATCVAGAFAKKPRTIASGQWGGPHIQLTVANGSATIEYDCASGTISGPLKIESSGRFSFLGKYMGGHGGPVRINEDSTGVPARYSGWTDGKTMKLTVTLVNAKTELATYQLTRGKVGRIFRCL